MAEVGSNVAAFLGKLWRMVEDPETSELISWSEVGHDQQQLTRKSFIKLGTMYPLLCSIYCQVALL